MPQLAGGVSGGQGIQFFAAVRIVDVAVATATEGVPGEVFKPVAVLVFCFFLAGRKAGPGGCGFVRQAGSEHGTPKVKGLFGKRRRGVAAALREDGGVTGAVLFDAAVKQDAATRSRRQDGQTHQCWRRVASFCKGTIDVAVYLVGSEAVGGERFAAVRCHLTAFMVDIVSAGIGAGRFLVVADELFER